MDELMQALQEFEQDVPNAEVLRPMGGDEFLAFLAEVRKEVNIPSRPDQHFSDSEIEQGGIFGL